VWGESSDAPLVDRVLYFAVRTVADTSIDIPNRAAFKASEVCEIAQIPSYVLRSWEKEFPGLGAAARPGGPRIYRREDVEQILRIKHLVFTEGLTLAGARRKIEGDTPIEEALVAAAPSGVPDTVKARVAEARQGLKDLLHLLSTPVGKRHAQHGQAPPAPMLAEDAAPAESHAEAAPTWPPEKKPRASLAARRQDAVHQVDLPLLETPEEPARKSRQARRGASPPHK
jgi:DNA-binding transcriptional MerR regulator